MELSTQVSLQNEKITQLEEVLEEKEREDSAAGSWAGGPLFPRGQRTLQNVYKKPQFSPNNNASPVVYDEDCIKDTQ